MANGAGSSFLETVSHSELAEDGAGIKPYRREYYHVSSKPVRQVTAKTILIRCSAPETKEHVYDLLEKEGIADPFELVLPGCTGQFHDDSLTDKAMWVNAGVSRHAAPEAKLVLAVTHVGCKAYDLGNKGFFYRMFHRHTKNDVVRHLCGMADEWKSRWPEDVFRSFLLETFFDDGDVEKAGFLVIG